MADMASYASHDSAWDQTGGSVTVTKPTGLAAGDLMVAFVTVLNLTSAPDTPSGWTAVTNVTTSGRYVQLFAKVADSSDAAASNFTFTHGTGSAELHVLLYRVTGTFTSAANIYATAAAVAGSEPSSNVFRYTNGITPNTASSLLILFATQDVGENDGTSDGYTLQTSNPTWTERLDTTPNAADNTKHVASATATRTEVTATGYFEITYSVGGGFDMGTAAGGGILIAITDTANGTHNATVITAAATINDPAASGGAQISPAVVTAAATINAPTATGGTNDALWKNQDKPSAGSITNLDKPA